MDWLKGMNKVVDYIEENLTQPIQYEVLSRIVGCSVYEFSRIFSFMAGMSISEYIRRRRLSQAAFDIQSGDEKIIDVALKYCYDSPTAVLTIIGGNAMNFRIEKKESFQIIGLSGYENAECKEGDSLTPLWCEFMDKYNSRLWNGGGNNKYYSAPFWQVAAYSYQSINGKTKAIIGAEYNGQNIEDMNVVTV